MSPSTLQPRPALFVEASIVDAIQGEVVTVERHEAKEEQHAGEGFSTDGDVTEALPQISRLVVWGMPTAM